MNDLRWWPVELETGLDGVAFTPTGEVPVFFVPIPNTREAADWWCEHYDGEDRKWNAAPSWLKKAIKAEFAKAEGDSQE